MGIQGFRAIQLRSVFKVVLTGLGLILASEAVQAQHLDIRYSSGVTRTQQIEIEKDVKLLQKAEFVDSTGEMQRIMKLDDTRGSSLEAWLSARMHYLLDIGHPVDKSALHYKSTDSILAGTVMSNIGAALYSEEKKNHSRIAMQIQGIGLVDITSPRVGILQLGTSFFKSFYESRAVSPLHDFVNVAFRLATMFHESRHSDGNGSSTGFFHVICPRGHPYQGLAACDTPSNGPYRIGALILSSIKEGCQKCSAGTKDALDVLRNDSLSRILTPVSKTGQTLNKEQQDIVSLNPFADTDSITEWDDTPEELQ